MAVGRTILVADDSMLVRRQVSTALKGAGYDVVEAVDGVDAAAKLDPDLAMIVCDLNMPRMNGLELLEQIHADVRMDGVPFVMLTTEARPQMYERAKELGAKAWLMKPFKPELFVAAVAKIVGAR